MSASRKRKSTRRVFDASALRVFSAGHPSRRRATAVGGHERAGRRAVRARWRERSSKGRRSKKAQKLLAQIFGADQAAAQPAPRPGAPRRPRRAQCGQSACLGNGHRSRQIRRPDHRVRRLTAGPRGNGHDCLALLQDHSDYDELAGARQSAAASALDSALSEIQGPRRCPRSPSRRSIGTIKEKEGIEEELETAGQTARRGRAFTAYTPAHASRRPSRVGGTSRNATPPGRGGRRFEIEKSERETQRSTKPKAPP